MDNKSYAEGKNIIAWSARLRWLTALFIIYVVLHLKFISQINFPLPVLFTIIFFGLAYNFIFPHLAVLFKPFRDWTLFIYLLGTSDLIFVTVLIHFTGGVNSPLVYLYFLLLIASSVFGHTFLGYIFTCQMTLLYMSSCLLEAMSIVQHYSLPRTANLTYFDFNHLSGAFSSLLLAGLLVTFVTSYLAQRLRDKQQEIEQLNRAQLDFVNTVIHETKSPLTSIIGYTDLIDSGYLGATGEKQREPLTIIKRQSQRILSMINDLLSLARLESGRAKIEKKPVDLAALASRVMEEFQPMMAAKQLTLVTEFDAKTPRLELDEEKIAEVITNLLTNAAKFSNPGEKIIISLAPNNEEVIFSVRDEGLGINAEDLPYIFDRFYRASKESAERKGTGLGLALSRSIIEAHDGRIWAVSAGPDQGAVFSFALPV
jgi:signal transduction histidine kinase